MADDFVAAPGEQAAVADIPIGEMALPAEVVQLVAFVMRPSQASVKGATLDADGGSYDEHRIGKLGSGSAHHIR
ncbi:hypothetical protein LCM4577_16370 [Mesorhizobium sp. LCM 4577]|uniref:Short-chain dehydrogenase/reductase SDR n=1 Tax=Mesorhizobium plurifarium TaxID=69974 RepID=A0A090DFA4_MESPL|nr:MULTISPECIES: hypothetical protein [unclassified Mesorhizobium]OHV60319.1 hypothetical protein LCM4577_16370 [Mesorhizobium sp. LCM 4577]OHV74262.1 hypothetical protein LCM4576_14350 [Mesorhizobium sp. LCM 4576]CDX14299.1 hypothetical protein MPL3356_150294 [Mesorhizobium plurifarium]CDX16984.1 hypothetical protein MPLB_1670056 [Mesorhizobium sp. ORS 3324]